MHSSHKLQSTNFWTALPTSRICGLSKALLATEEERSSLAFFPLPASSRGSRGAGPFLPLALSNNVSSPLYQPAAAAAAVKLLL